MPPINTLIPNHIKMTTLPALNRKALVVMGAICGDIIGSAYERHGIKNVDFPLFTPRSRFTDETVTTIAIADGLINRKSLTTTLQKWCRRYPGAGYGGQFRKWMYAENPMPYNSWGNGSAMRVSAAGILGATEAEVLALAKKSAEITHNHPEGVKGAQATALAIYLALNGVSKKQIKAEIETRFGYNLSRDYSAIKATYRFDVSCQGSVPEAIIAFLASTDYESTVRNAVALGGDADTQAAIAGGIAAAYYGSIPTYILTECAQRLDKEIGDVLIQLNHRTGNL